MPLTWKQLLDQVRKEIDRAGATVKEGLVRFGNVTVDLLSMEVRRYDRPVSLTAMEFKVLKYLVSNPNRVISRDDSSGLKCGAMKTIPARAPSTITF